MGQAKEKVKAMASRDGRHVSAEQTELWEEYKKLRNKINNRIKQEEKGTKRRRLVSVDLVLPRPGDLLRSSWSGALLDLQHNLR